MDRGAIRAMARLIYDTDKPRGKEMRSWLYDGVMSASQRKRLGRSSKPSCFPSEEDWIAWCIQEACRPVPNSGHCYDCTRRYQRAMADNNLCEHPLTIFVPVGTLRHRDTVGRRAPSRR